MLLGRVPSRRMLENMKQMASRICMRGPNAPVLIVVCGDTLRKIYRPGQDYELANGKSKMKEGLGARTGTRLYIQLVQRIPLLSG